MWVATGNQLNDSRAQSSVYFLSSVCCALGIVVLTKLLELQTAV